MNHFDILARDPNSEARVAVIHTPHGDIHTPTFIPVATRAAVKSLDPDFLRQAGAEVLISNAYHLSLAPGIELIKEAGGVARFMAWNGPTLTDSGGYQVSYMWHGGKDKPSLDDDDGRQPGVSRISDDGVTIVPHTDGVKRLFTPESSMMIQNAIGADIIMAFDQPTIDAASYKDAEMSVLRTTLWAARSKAKWLELEAERKDENRQMLFGIIQGGRHEDLRRQSAEAILALDLPGVAIGGETIGIEPEVTAMALDTIRDLVPRDRPYYAMGMGGLPEAFFLAAERGVDLFDNTSVTRMARTGLLFVSPENGGTKANKFRYSITNAEFRTDAEPVDPGCDCYTCQTFSRQYLYHLFKSKELLAYRLASIHNIRFMLRLGASIREHIGAGTLRELRAHWLR